MSAWIVSKSHIDLIVAALAHGTRDGVILPLEFAAASDPDRLGQALVTECVRSVSYRYPSDAPGELPGPCDGYYLQPYAYADPGYRPTAAELARALTCYVYQSCEHPGWEDSAARDLAQAVLQAITARVPGARLRASPDGASSAWPEYDAAPWGFEAETVAALRADLCRSLGMGPDLPDDALFDVLAQTPYAEQVEGGRRRKALETALRRERERLEHAAAHLHLVQRTDRPDWSPARLTAENVRRDLKRHFPGVKFRVRADGYDSCTVHWTCGPTTKEVEAITNCYRRGNFNGMEDHYEDDPDNTFADIFGGARYVFATRDYPQEGLEACWRQLAEQYGVPYVGRDTRINALNGYVTDLVYRILQAHPLPDGLHGLKPAGGVTSGSLDEFWRAV